mgnify:CR=1 FL=1
MNNPKNEPARNSHGRVTFLDGQNEMAMLEISTRWSSAEMYLHGAHVTRFKRLDEPGMLFMSQCSRFQAEQPIRGGVPVIFPWFGMREGLGQHGFARIKEWDLREVLPTEDGRVSVRLRLRDCPDAAAFPPFTAEYVVTVGESLGLEFTVTNNADEVLTFEECLHSYFEVGDVTAIAIRGLEGTEYLDKVANFARKRDNDAEIRIGAEVDRTYVNTTSRVEIIDPRLSRKIVVEKENSRSTVVWNPWIGKAQQMMDFGNDEYQRMVCVESGNVGENQVSLGPGETSRLAVRLRIEGLK